MEITNEKFGAGFVARIVHGVEEKIVDNAIKKLAIGSDEAGAISVFDKEVTTVVFEKIIELATDGIADFAHSDWFHFKEAIFETTDFGEVVDLLDSAL